MLTMLPTVQAMMSFSAERRESVTDDGAYATGARYPREFGWRPVTANGDAHCPLLDLRDRRTDAPCDGGFMIGVGPYVFMLDHESSVPDPGLSILIGGA
jgi:hypothetical protein